MEYSNLRDELKHAVEIAEELAIESIKNNVDFSPYIFSGDKQIRRFFSDSLEDAIENAIEEIENMEEETVVLIFKDTIALKDGSFDAIVSQIYNDDEDFGHSFGLLYKIEDNTIKFLNKRVFLGEIRNCLIF